MEIAIAIIIVIVFIIARASFNQKNRNIKSQTMVIERNDSLLKELDNITQKFTDDSYLFATDNNAKEFIIIHNDTEVSRSPHARKGELSDYKTVNYFYKGKYSDILQVELLINENIVETYKKGTFTRAAIGGLMFGGAGAIVGASSANSYSSTNISSVMICITVNDAKKPLHKISINTPDGGRSFITVERAREMLAVFTYMMKSEEKQLDIDSKSPSVADELHKLGLLREKGLLDENEFNSLKKKIIENSLSNNIQ